MHWRLRSFLAGAMVLGAAGGLRAQWVVFDPRAAADAYVRWQQLRNLGHTAQRHLRKAEETAARLREDARRFRGFRIADFRGSRRGYERLFGASPLGYNHPALDRAFRAAFPESRIDRAIRGASAEQQALIRRAAYTLAMGTGRQGEQLRDAERVLDQVRRLATGAATHAEIAQSQAAIDALAVEEAQQARQLQIATASQQATMDAYRIGREARDDSVSAATAAAQAEREAQVREGVDRWKRAQEVPAAVWRPGVRASDLGLETAPTRGRAPRAGRDRP